MEMQARVEVWPVAADQQGLWLISGRGPWVAGLPVMADDDPHSDVEYTLTSNGIALADAPLIHSTSWRVAGQGLLLTYLAVVRRPGYVRENWPAAEPISPRLPGAVGRPLPHDAAEPPVEIREVDVLLHALRHARFLWEWDATAAAVFDTDWVRHLSVLKPALAGMYSEVCDLEVRAA